MFFNSEQFPAIAQNLDPRNPEPVRLRAIQQLSAIPASDAQAADNWAEIRSYLNSSLKDTNESISVINTFKNMHILLKTSILCNYKKLKKIKHKRLNFQLNKLFVLFLILFCSITLFTLKFKRICVYVCILARLPHHTTKCPSKSLRI